MSASLWLLAFGLAADAALVAAIVGSQVRNLHQGLMLATATGIAQAAMPLLGAFIGGYARDVASWTNYLAAAVFCVLAWKLATDQVDHTASDPNPPPSLTPMRYLVIAFATSIDALVAGATFPVLGLPPISTSLIIGGVTFVVCAAAFWAGASLTPRLGRAVRYVGAALLLAVAAQSVR